MKKNLDTDEHTSDGVVFKQSDQMIGIEFTSNGVVRGSGENIGKRSLPPLVPTFYVGMLA